jgi:hypothetical protein
LAEATIGFNEALFARLCAPTLSPHLAMLGCFWYALRMETTPFDLTPAQKGVLEALARKTGKAIPALLDEALEGLQAHVRPGPGPSATNGGTAAETGPPPPPTTPHIWDIAADLLAEVPDEALNRLPPDGAAQHDHYISGTPKRPA